MQIRPATHDDLPAIVALLADDELGRQREAAGHPLPPEYGNAFAEIDADPDNVLVVMEDAGEVVATLQVTFIRYLTFRGGRRAQIEAVRTARNRRGEGLGRALMAWAITEAERRRCHLVQLTTNLDRGEAHAFYEELGFVATHRGMKRYLEGDVTGR